MLSFTCRNRSTHPLMAVMTEADCYYIPNLPWKGGDDLLDVHAGLPILANVPVPLLSAFIHCVYAARNLPTSDLLRSLELLAIRFDLLW